MAVFAKITQLHAAPETLSGDAMLAASYIVVDSTAGTSAYRHVFDIACPTGTPGVWKANISQAVIAHAALAGYTLPIENLQWLPGEPGNAKYPRIAAIWNKDITRTNIGTTLVNVYNGSGGEAQLVDFDSYHEGRFVIYANKVGSGNLTMRLVDTTNAANFVELIYTNAAGEFMLESNWVTLPAWATGQKTVKPMASSSVAQDDPIFRSFILYLR